MRNTRMDKPAVSLKDILPCDHFRTVESFRCLRAPSEIPVNITLKDRFRKTLSFPTEWDGIMYGYARYTERLTQLLVDSGIPATGDVLLSITDWDDKFDLSVEERSLKREASFFVTDADVRELLEGCCRIPAQRSK